MHPLPSNTWLPGPTRLSIPNGISIGSAIFAQLSAESPCRLGYTLQLATILPIKTVPSHVRIWTPIYCMIPLSHPSPPQRTSRSFQSFCRALGKESLYFIIDCPFPLKIASSHGESVPPIQHTVSWSHPSPPAKQHLDQLSRFRRVHDRDRPDHATPAVIPVSQLR